MVQDASSDPTPFLPDFDAPRLDRLIAPEARELMRREIAEIGGAEVFFIGRLTPELVVDDVEALAYGNRRAVPAIQQNARPGDVVIHNHPSGHLEPSDADIAVSSELGSRGIGSYIIDNDVSSIRVIVKPFKRPGLEPINIDQLRNWLLPGGRVSERLDGYEHRPQQVAMLEAVAEAFNRDGLAVIEAGTGTGKSMAYLLPAIAWALRNEEKVVVATHTINLQEQLLEKDLPLVLAATGMKFEAALLKGRNNYLCRRKAAYLKANPDFLETPERAEQLDQIQEWIKTTREGSLSDLPFQPDRDIWEKVMSEGDNCLRTRCPHYNQCFFYNARRRAARAQVLVVNHHLLMADLALRAESNNYTQSAVLPPFHRLIIDEAHHLDEVATGYFGLRVGRSGFVLGMRRLVRPKTGEGLLRFLAHKIHTNLYKLPPAEHDDLLQRLGREAPLQHSQVLSAIEDATEQVAMAMEQDSRTPLDQPLELKRRIRDNERNTPFWLEVVDPAVRQVLTALRPYLETLRRIGRVLHRYVEEGTTDQASPLLELNSSLNKLETLLQRLMRFLAEDDGQCRWIELRRRRGGRRPEITFCCAPLKIAPQIREHVLRRFRSVVLTSATMTVERRFDFILNQFGATDPALLSLTGHAATQADAAPREPGPADGAEANDTAPRSDIEQPPPVAAEPMPAGRHVRTLLLDTPFDFDRQVYIGIPSDLPDPTASGFDRALGDFLLPALRCSRGRAFILFTAYSLLQRLFDRLAPTLEGHGFPCLRQGQSSRSMLTEAFRRQIGSVLFATSSFWEGVDVQGEALSLLVLTRLPFRVPGEPLVEARIEALRAEGIDPFKALIIPQAVIKFRQGFGRLIRSRNDCGAVLICDRRVVNRHYGRMFLDSLPTANIHTAPAAEVLRNMGDFYHGPTQDDWI